MTRPAERFGDPSAEVLQGAAAAFGLLASPMRLHIVWILAQGDCDVTGLAERVGATLPAVSQHLAKLKLAGLVHARREGRRQVYLVDDPGVVTVVRVMVDQLGGVEPPAGDGRGGGRRDGEPLPVQRLGRGPAVSRGARGLGA